MDILIDEQIITVMGGRLKINYDENLDAEPIHINNVPYMVMGHAQFYTDCRILHIATHQPSDLSLYGEAVMGDTIFMAKLVQEIMDHSGLLKLLNRHIDSLKIFKMTEDYDRVTSSHRGMTGRIPSMPPRRPLSITPDGIIKWIKLIESALRERKIRVPKFANMKKYKYHWIDEPTVKLSNDKIERCQQLILADIQCAKSVLCLERVYVRAADWLDDAMEAISAAYERL